MGLCDGFVCAQLHQHVAKKNLVAALAETDGEVYSHTTDRFVLNDDIL